MDATDMHGRDISFTGKDSQNVGDGRLGAFGDRKPAGEALPVLIERGELRECAEER